MRIALFGQTGQVATEVQRRAPKGSALTVLGREAADFAHPEQIYSVARSLKVDAIINAAAYTAVDKAESEPDLANAINGASVGALGRACAETGIPLVHISTDYVFSGDGETPWKPGDPTDPQGAYGQSKLAGEHALAEYPGAFVTLRTSWVFSAHGNNFVKTMLRVGAERDRLTVVDDQIGGPTAARDIADTCLHLAAALADGQPGGTYHFSGAPDASWADFAEAIFARSAPSPTIERIPSSAYPTPAKRPANSRLDCTSLETDFGIKRPDWAASLDQVLKELGAYAP